MAYEVRLTTDGLLINWLRAVGENVSSEDIIAEVEADKATVEIEAGSDGTLLELRAEPERLPARRETIPDPQKI